MQWQGIQMHRPMYPTVLEHQGRQQAVSVLLSEPWSCRFRCISEAELLSAFVCTLFPPLLRTARPVMKKRMAF